MTAEVLFERFREHWRAIAWWSLGIGVFVTVTLVFYPSIRDSAGLSTYAEKLPESMRALFIGGELDLTSPVGYLNSQIFALMAPILLAVFAISTGASSIAGDEENGALDLGLAQPVSRTSMVIQLFFWLSAGVFMLSAVLLASVVVASIPFDLHVSFENLLAVTISTGLFGLMFGSVALTVGCFAPGRNRAVAIAASAALASWMLDGLAKSVSWLEPFQVLSPYHQAFGQSPLTNGYPWAGWAVMAVVIAALVGSSVFALNRRDVHQ